MTPLGLIGNARSGGNRGGLAALESQVAGAGGAISYQRLEAMDDLPGILEDLTQQGVEVIAIAGGDGTVQAVLTELLKNPLAAKMPKLAILPCGTTNMTAADVGLRGRPATALVRLLAQWRKGDLGPYECRRHVLRVENAVGYPPQWGMFFGAAWIYQAIQICRDKVESRGLRSDWAAGITLIGMLLTQLVRHDVFRGEEMERLIDGGAAVTGLYSLMLATTLDRLVMGSRPFWNQGGGPVRLTSIRYPPRRLWSAGPRILYGGEQRRFPSDDYESRGAGRVELVMSCPFTLDGELFETVPGRAVIITADDEVTFIRL